MRVTDLDRDMSDVIPTGTTRDSAFLFERMTQATVDRTGAAPGRLILDVASGFGQDAIALRSRGAQVIGAEPSQVMTAWARMKSAEAKGPLPHWVRGWGDALPFATGSFDAAFCKGSLDHFDRPETAIAEMARVTARGGVVVLTLANFESLSCRASRLVDAARETLLRRPPRRGRRAYDVPSDHFTRYELDLIREQASRHLDLELVEGVSLCWGIPGWSQLIQRLRPQTADRLLQALDGLARRLPRLADVLVLAGSPLRSA